MANPGTFLATIAALSTAVQTVVDHLLKGELAWLSTPRADPKAESSRHSTIHLISFVLGGAISWGVGFFPLAELGSAQGRVPDARQPFAARP